MLDRRLPPDLRQDYNLSYGVGEDFHIISLEVWRRDGGRIASYHVLNENGHFSPVLLEAAVVGAIADCRAHQKGES